MHILARGAPRLIVAAGHAAGYVVRALARHPDPAVRIALVAPTWRGALPTMMGRRPGWLHGVVRAIDAAVIGPLLYRLNLSDFVIGRMARGPVYSDAGWLAEARRAQKRAVVRAPGASFASARFVTGALDPAMEADTIHDAAAMIDASRLMLLWGAETPCRSKAAMDAWAAARGADPVVSPQGKLFVHEEFPHEVAQAILARWSDAAHREVGHDR